MHDEDSREDAREATPSPVAVLTQLRTLHYQWSAAAARIGQAHGARDQMVAADIVLQELESTAAQAGLILADALAGRAPEVATLLLEWLAVESPTPEPKPEPEPEPQPEPEPTAETPQPAEPTEETLPPDEQPTVPLAQLAPPKPVPPPVAVSDTTALELQASLNGHALVAPRRTDSHKQHRALEKLRKTLGGVPPNLGRRDAVMSVLKQMELAVGETENWSHVGAAGRRIMLEAIAARVRAIQEVEAKVPDLRVDDDAGIRAAQVMRNLRKLTELDLDRLAWGLALRHEPRFGSWLDDARTIQLELEEELGIDRAPPPFNADDAFRRLRADIDTLKPAQLRERLTLMLDNKVADTEKRFVGLLDSRLPDLADDPKLRRLLRRVSDALDDDDRDDEPVLVAIDPNWPGLQHTRGKRAVIVGGDGREERRPQIRDAFQFAELEWPDVPKGAPGKVASLVEQVRGKRYDIVICLQRFISHGVTDQLFGLDVPGVRVVLATGYGVQQVRAALDRYLPRAG